MLDQVDLYDHCDSVLKGPLSGSNARLFEISIEQYYLIVDTDQEVEPLVCQIFMSQNYGYKSIWSLLYLPFSIVILIRALLRGSIITSSYIIE